MRALEGSNHPRREAATELLPAAIDPAGLDGGQRLALASWFSPGQRPGRESGRSGGTGGRSAGARRGGRGNTRRHTDSGAKQLELWPQG